MNKLSIVALLLSLSFLGLAISTKGKNLCNPYFIDTTEVLGADFEMQALNQRIGLQDEFLKQKEQAFTDSIMGLFDSLSVRDEKKDALVELLNLESNLFRHHMIDSISRASQAEVAEVTKKINKRIENFCEKNGVEILFGSNANTVIYGTGTKADKTKELLTYFEANHE